MMFWIAMILWLCSIVFLLRALAWCTRDEV